MEKHFQTGESSTRISTSGRAAAAIPIHGLHHFAWRCRDAEETRHFYEDLLGLPLWHIIQSDHVPSTGEYCPYTHLFFRMSDGSCVAFFDLGDDVAAAPSPNTPSWVNHLALRIDTVEHLERIKAKLERAGVEVIGVTDHHIFKSIYFFDPNGIRLELTAQIASEMQMLEQSRAVHERLAQWTQRKQAWRAERAAGRDPGALKPQVDDRPEVAERAAASDQAG
jgi:catechol 2,3-dioxygenase-like lactoylglutathione lyase family enzyme